MWLLWNTWNKTCSIASCLLYQSRKWVTGIYLCQASPKLAKDCKTSQIPFPCKIPTKEQCEKKQGQQGRWSSSAIKRGQNPHHALSLKCFEKTLKTCAHPAYEVLQTSMLNMMSLYLHAFSRRPYWCFLGGDLPFYGFSSLSLADMKFVQNFTHPDFQAKNFTPQKCVNCDIFLANQQRKCIKYQ